MSFNVYVVLIQDVKDLIEQKNVSIFHSLRERNQRANFMVKFRVSSDVEMLYRVPPLDDLLSLIGWRQLKLFFRVVFFVLFLFLCLFSFLSFHLAM